MHENSTDLYTYTLEMGNAKRAKTRLQCEEA